jgi:epoxyqueuosine reductase
LGIVNDRIEHRLKAKAREMGFELAGIARAAAADGFERYSQWLDRGYAGEMDYLHRHAEARRHPDSILADVRSVLMLGMTHENSPAPPQSAPSFARIAKYAQAPDYHEVLWAKLNDLGDWLAAEVPGARSRGVVDTAPLLERDFARRAGLGWIGKNTMLLNKQLGSFFMLGALLTTLELQPDAEHPGEHCGTCTACLQACPTQAFPEPGWLDARRCISYLTIELKNSIPEELRPSIGDWLFGCDVCQDVCPWNHRTGPTPGMRSRQDLLSIDPRELLTLSPMELRRRFRGTALRRANWRGLLRNAAIVLGNHGDPGAIPVLQRAMQWDDEVVRDSCAWAIRQIEARQALLIDRSQVSLRVVV